MSVAPASTESIVNTVLGPVPASDLGVTSVHESLLSVLPGAQYAFDITLDRAEIFQALAEKLTAFKAAGGGTIVDSTGMFHGRDVPLYEALSRSTGVHIVASTGQGPEAMLGGYFLTPQTNPPTPWPADKFAELFGTEVSEGMVVPRVERRGLAGLVATAVTRSGMTATDESLLRGTARAALATGVPASVRFGSDAIAELGVLLTEGLLPDRVVVGNLDRKDAARSGAPLSVAEAGAHVGLDHVGSEDDEHLSDAERATLVVRLVEAGHADRILLSSSATGVAKGHPATDVAYEHVMTSFASLLKKQGVSQSTIRTILVANPAALLSVSNTPTSPTNV